MSSEIFSLEVVTTEGEQVVALRGELDVASADSVRRTLLSSELPVVVDMADLTFIDSSGLTALVHASNELTKRGLAFRVRGVSPDLRRLFELTGLTKLIDES
jgi:anti-sigma B factor antagonist